LAAQLQKLAAVEPQSAPVISLYLNLTANHVGRDDFAAFCRKAFAEQLRSYGEGSEGRASLQEGLDRITTYLANELNRGANGLAIFASDDLFEAVQLDAPVEEHWLFIGAVPHLYPLMRIADQYPRYAAVLLDTNRARILVFALGAIARREEVTGVKTRRTSAGGWSQARYQRRAENMHLHHVKDVAEALNEIVQADAIEHVILVGDDTVTALLRKELPAPLAEKVVDTVKLDRHAAEDEIVRSTLDVLRRKDAETDVERVAEAVDAWRSGGLGVAGPEATLKALQIGQVDELLIAGTPEALKSVQKLPDGSAPPPVAAETSSAVAVDDKRLQLSDELVTRAQQTGARVRIVEDPELLRNCGGVAALLRFRR
jgi:peptide subunit release factor 1 (eRF1)